MPQLWSDTPVKIFVSWSGTQSRAMAEALRWWMPKVLQGVVPFVSAKDIDKGSNWTMVLDEELQTTDFGIVCLAADNLQSPWLHYEVGALNKSVTARVCPLLYGIKKRDVGSPLNQLQLTEFELDDVRLMMHSVNKSKPQPLTDEHLNEAVDMWWPRLVERFEALPAAVAATLDTAVEPTQPAVTPSDLVGEVLEEVRLLRVDVDFLRRDMRTQKAARRMPVEGDRELSTTHQFEMLTQILNREGLALRGGTADKDTLSAVISRNADALSARVHKSISDLARLAARTIVISADDGTSVVFDQDGISSTPPF